MEGRLDRGFSAFQEDGFGAQFARRVVGHAAAEESLETFIGHLPDHGCDGFLALLRADADFGVEDVEIAGRAADQVGVADDADAAEALAGERAQVAEQFVERHRDLDNGNSRYPLCALSEAAARDDDFGVRILQDMSFDAGVVGVLDLDLDTQFARYRGRNVRDALHRADEQNGWHGAVFSAV